MKKQPVWKVQPVIPKDVPLSPNTHMELRITIDKDEETSDSKRMNKETEKKETDSIYSRLKQAACSRDEKVAEKRWKRVEELFEQHQYNKDKKQILAKLDDEQFAPIHHAVRYNNVFVCDKLLSAEYESDVNLVGQDGQTPLHLAAINPGIEENLEIHPNDESKRDVLSVLLRCKGIKMNSQDDDGRTPLHYALLERHRNIALAMFPKMDYKDFYIQDIKGATPIHYAFTFMNKEDIKKYFGMNEKTFIKNAVQLKTIENKTPFEMAVDNRNAGFIEKMIPETLKEKSDQSRWNLVRAVFLSDHRKIAFDIPWEQITTAIILAACREKHGYRLLNDRIIDILSADDTLMKAIYDDGTTPLMVAIKWQRKEFIKTVFSHSNLSKCKWIDEKTDDLERTALHFCAEYGDKDIAELIDDKARRENADFRKMDATGRTPLHICAENNNIDMCELLLGIKQKTSSAPGSTNGSSFTPIDLLNIRDNYGFTPFLCAIECGHDKIVKVMIETVGNGKQSFMEQTDEKKQTGLHIAALKGNLKIVELLLENNASPHSLNIHENTPLHEAARWSDSSKEENENRVRCMEKLIEKGADVNALNLRRESALHVACRYGSSAMVECLMGKDTNRLRTNIHGFNCLEVAIEENNTLVVKYLIDQDYIFDLMRNAQLYYNGNGNRTTARVPTDSDGCCCEPCCCCGGTDKCSGFRSLFRYDKRQADTPMRKLIISMPDMAYRVLDKCTKTVGNDRSTANENVFDYEFLEDQYSISDWIAGNLNNHCRGKRYVKENEITSDETYTSDYKTLVMNHPLFLMAEHDCFKLMAHPLSKSLVYKKFYYTSLIILIMLLLLYGAFLGLFTTMIFRSKPPHVYYNMTNIEFKENLCRNVTQALDDTIRKSPIDYVLLNCMYGFIGINIIKNIFAFFAYLRINPLKTLTFAWEIVSIALCLRFLTDEDFQKNYVMRCPEQWQAGSFGLLIGYIGVFYYMQFIPVLGIYVLMLVHILIRFLLFLPVIMVLISAFALPFYMMFGNFASLSNVGIALAKIAIMSSGELGYDEFLFNEETKAYYVSGFALLIIFTIVMVVLVTNLLIGLAVGEIEPMMKSAKNHRLDRLYELTADLEIIKYGLSYLFTFCCIKYKTSVVHYNKQDLTTKSGRWHNYKKSCLLNCAGEVDDDALENESNDESGEYQQRIVEVIRQEVHALHTPHTTTDSGKKIQKTAKQVMIAKQSKPRKK